MKTTLLFFLSLLVSAAAFAESFTLDNLTSYPMKEKHSKIAVQWASTAQEVQQANQAILNGSSLDPKTLQTLNQTGKINLTIPDHAEYFRILVWSKSEEEPDLHTNWVEIIPNKTYTLTPAHLVPTVLMAGSGC